MCSPMPATIEFEIVMIIKSVLTNAYLKIARSLEMRDLVSSSSSFFPFSRFFLISSDDRAFTMYPTRLQTVMSKASILYVFLSPKLSSRSWIAGLIVNIPAPDAAEISPRAKDLFLSKCETTARIVEL